LTRSTLKGQKVEKVRDFAGNILHFKTRLLLDGNDQVVCSEDVDINTNVPNFKNTTKHLSGTDGRKF
jgi:hypothetical protein